MANLNVTLTHAIAGLLPNAATNQVIPLPDGTNEDTEELAIGGISVQGALVATSELNCFELLAEGACWVSIQVGAHDAVAGSCRAMLAGEYRQYYAPPGATVAVIEKTA
jgi:hypothetical protein